MWRCTFIFTGSCHHWTSVGLARKATPRAARARAGWVLAYLELTVGRAGPLRGIRVAAVSSAWPTEQSMRSYSWLKGTKSIEQLIWFHFTSFSKAFGSRIHGSSDADSDGDSWCDIRMRRSGGDPSPAPSLQSPP